MKYGGPRDLLKSNLNGYTFYTMLISGRRYDASCTCTYATSSKNFESGVHNLSSISFLFNTGIYTLSYIPVGIGEGSEKFNYASF